MIRHLGIMANATVFTELKDYHDYFKSLSFHDQVKAAMKWSSDDWERLELSSSKFKRLLNSGRFWRAKLLGAFHECNVILTLHSEAPGGFLSPQRIIEEIEAQFPDMNITGHNRFRNPRYISIDFGNSDMKKFILDNLKVIGNFNVYFLNWAADNDDITIRVHWLTKNITVDKILLVLNMYFIAKFVKTETSVYPNGKAYGCGVSTFVGRLKSGILMDQVPHIAKIAGLESLWTIPTRLPLCLRCDNIGHKAFECKLSHCRACKKFQTKDHVCLGVEGVKSYAQVLKKDHDISESEEDLDFEDSNIGNEGDCNNTSVSALGASTVAEAGAAELLSSKNPAPLESPPILLNVSSILDPDVSKALPSGGSGDFTNKLDVLVLPTTTENSASVLAQPYEEGDTFNVVSRRNRPTKESQKQKKNLGPGILPHTYSRTATRSVTKTENLFDSLQKVEAEGVGRGSSANSN